MERTGAAAVIIGNEVLTAKVNELNGAHLVKRLRERAIPLQCVLTVPDDVDAIVEAVLFARRRARFVFTSGGIGPTHDDVTVRAVALALGREVVQLPEMVELVRTYFGDALKPEARRLAEAPAGSTLIAQAQSRFPVLACDEIFMLPGVPQLFRWQLEAVLPLLPQGRVVVKVLYLDTSESEIAAVLDQVALARPEVALGSYPTFEHDAGYRVKLTIEHADEGPVAEVLARLKAELPAKIIVGEG